MKRTTMLAMLLGLTVLLMACADSGGNGGSNDDGNSNGGISGAPDLTVIVDAIGNGSISANNAATEFTIENVSSDTEAGPPTVYFFADRGSAPTSSSGADSFFEYDSGSLSPGGVFSDTIEFIPDSARNGGTAYLWVELGDDGDTSNNASSGFSWGPTFTYTITGASLDVGDRVNVIRADDDPTCGPMVADIELVASETVTVEDTVTITYSDARTGDFWESVYIDVDASENLTDGDLVWGSNPADVVGVCGSESAYWMRDQTFDWDTIAGGVGGSSTWSGGAQAFLVSPDGPTQTMRTSGFLPWSVGEEQAY